MSQKECSRGFRLPQRITSIFTRNREYPIIDKIVVAYIGVVLFFQVLLQISPVVTFLTTTPLYSVQTYLGLLGGFLIVLDCFTTKRIWQGKYCVLLLAILGLALLASVRTIAYGTKENLFKLCWMAIQFTLVYTCAFRLEREQFRKFVKYLFYGLLAIWFVACCVSLYQYVNQIGYTYVVNPLAQDSSLNRQGFYDNRLFGIFYTLNHAAYISLFFMVIAVVCMVTEKRVWLKVCLGVAAFALLCYIILSGSRSAMISLVACGAVMPWFAVRNKLKVAGVLKPVICCAVAVAVAAVCYFGYTGLKNGLTQVPYLKQLFVYNLQNDDPSNPSVDPTDPSGAPVVDPSDPTADATVDPTDPSGAPIDPSDPTADSPTAPTKKPMEKPTYDEDILSREYLDEDISNDRMEIWSDYIRLYKEIGVMGLSPGNYMPYIMENHADLFIVDYIKQNYPDKYESGIIYHVHSGYMMVYVSAGIAGILSLAVFVLLYLIRLIAIILKNKKISALFVGAFALVVSGALSAFFDEGLFFQNNVQTTIFWLALGVLMCQSMANLKEESDASLKEIDDGKDA